MADEQKKTVSFTMKQADALAMYVAGLYHSNINFDIIQDGNNMDVIITGEI